MLPAGVVELELVGLADGEAPWVLVDGVERPVPTFRSGDGRLLVRIRADGPGRVELRGSETGQVVDSRVVEVEQFAGPPRLWADGRHLHGDDGPFLWLADTWWYAFVDRVSDEEFALLARRRAEQGFSVIHVCAGLYPEISGFDPLGATDGHWSWLADGSDVDPLWWDAADARITSLLEHGLVPAIVGAWSYYLGLVGAEAMQRHWREILARWGAYPVVWVVAGELGLPGYEVVGRPDEAERVAECVEAWRSHVRWLRDTQPFANPVTIHPCPAFHLTSTDVLGDRELLDLVWMQTGHTERASVPVSLDALDREVASHPVLPVINSEVCYEGIAAGSHATMQRFLFYSHLLSGAAGHSYGAQGLWGFRSAADPGPGAEWGSADWASAFELAGGRHVGLGATLLRDLAWAELTPRPSGMAPHASRSDRFGPYLAASEHQFVAYFPAASLLGLDGYGMALAYRDVTFSGVSHGGWEAELVDPRTGAVAHRYPSHEVGPDGTWALPRAHPGLGLPSLEDWLLIARRAT